MLLFDGRGGCGIDGLVDPPTEVGDLPGRGVDVDLHMLRLSVRGDKCGAGPLPGTTYPRDDLISAAGSLGGSRLLPTHRCTSAQHHRHSSQGNRGDDDWQVEAVGDRIRCRSSAHC